ncbi:MAG: hypothetical protein GX677_00820 [Treponema sp.]|nr:hypothetical protein [Treponema sp.]
MGQKRDQKNILIGVLLIAIVVMAVGYATFATTLTIGGTANVSGNWNVAITGIEVADKSAGASSTTNTYTGTTATFAADLAAPTDWIEYTVTVKNNGSIDATLDEISQVIAEGGSDAITFTVTAPEADSTLASGDTVTVTVKAAYNDVDVEPDVTSKSLTITLDYVQKV